MTLPADPVAAALAPLQTAAAALGSAADDAASAFATAAQGALAASALQPAVACAGTAVTDVQDLTSQFTISAANTINNAAGTASTGGKLLVRWTKLTP